MITILCEFCRMELHPLCLKQVIEIKDELLFDVECINMECRHHNLISEHHYLHLRKDHLKPYPFKLNNKMPSEMNVMIVSMERCGISWIAFVLRNIHEAMFGVPIEWKFEVSHVIARKKHLPIFEGWNTVYNIDPQKLIDRNYDRILIIQRDFDTLLKAYMLYNRDELNGECVIPNEEAMIRRFKREYELVYGKEINNMKCLKIRLEDLNRYTVDTFNEILDFLNFPSFGRPIIIPTRPPQRNWEAYSSMLPKGHELCSRLKEIDKNTKM